jgi:hypothetical protein
MVLRSSKKSSKSSKSSKKSYVPRPPVPVAVAVPPPLAQELLRQSCFQQVYLRNQRQVAFPAGAASWGQRRPQETAARRPRPQETAARPRHRHRRSRHQQLHQASP